MLWFLCFDVVLLPLLLTSFPEQTSTKGICFPGGERQSFWDYVPSRFLSMVLGPALMVGLGSLLRGISSGFSRSLGDDVPQTLLGACLPSAVQASDPHTDEGGGAKDQERHQGFGLCA